MIKREKHKKVSEKLQITFFLTTFALDFYYLPILLITKTNKTMKKNIMRFAVVALALFAMPTFMHAQLGKLANKAKAAANTAKTLNSEENLIGDEEITEKDLKATWSYREPGLSFAKGNAAVKAGAKPVDMTFLPTPGCKVTASCFLNRQSPHGILNHSLRSAARPPFFPKMIISR